MYVHFVTIKILTDTCIEENSSNSGTIGLAYQNLWEARACQWMCQKIYWCAAFTFNKKFQYCLLHKSVSENTQLDPYSVTGPKICGNKGGEFDRHI